MSQLNVGRTHLGWKLRLMSVKTPAMEVLVTMASSKSGCMVEVTYQSTANVLLVFTCSPFPFL